MRPLLPLSLLALLLLPAAGGAEAWYSREWPEQTLHQAKRIIATWEHEARGVDKELEGAELPAPGAAAEAEETAAADDTVISCDGAMLFDAASNNIVYVGNVRLCDPRLSLRADGRLFIRLPEREVSQKQETARQSINNLSEDTPETDADKEPEAADEQVYILPAGMQPLRITARDAVVDTEANHLILFSPAGSAAVVLESGSNKLTVTPAADSPAHILADAEGNISVVGADIRAEWTDEQQRRAELHVCGGSLCYNAAEHALALTGACSLHHPSGDISCGRSLLVRLQGEHTVPEDAAFLQQFTKLSVTGLAAVHAEGGVEAAAASAGECPSAELRGEVLDYDAESGLCTLTGEQCALSYNGQYSLEGAQRICLTPEGVLRVEGRELSGTYTRPNEGEGEPLTGTFRTGGLITFTPEGDRATVCLPQGITAEDAAAAFSCTGELTATLLPDEKVAATTVANSKLNLALLRYRNIDHAAASGDILARRRDPATGAETGLLQAERAEFDLIHRAAELFGTHDKAIVAHYDGNRLEATPDGDALPHLSFSAEGDAELRGGLITATLHDEKNGAITARCAHALRLLRSQNRLETDGAAEFRAEEGVLITNDSFYALLVADENAAASQKGLMSFPYKGVREAATDKGGSVQTTKGSMQCTGPIRVTMDNTAADGKMGGLRTASAEGSVMLAGKDPSGRLIRAAGDRLTMDAATGEKVLSGSRVTLEDAYNTHTATGPNAAVRIDARNSATLTGSTHTTTVKRIREQIEKQTKKD